MSPIALFLWQVLIWTSAVMALRMLWGMGWAYWQRGINASADDRRLTRYSVVACVSTGLLVVRMTRVALTRIVVPVTWDDWAVPALFALVAWAYGGVMRSRANRNLP
jgi:hypothetical protein